MIRIIVKDEDLRGVAAGAKEQASIVFKSFDVSVPELENYIAKCPKDDSNPYWTREIIGVEILPRV